MLKQSDNGLKETEMSAHMIAQFEKMRCNCVGRYTKHQNIGLQRFDGGAAPTILCAPDSGDSKHRAALAKSTRFVSDWRHCSYLCHSRTR
jgi:hypothetical protein